MVFTDTWWQYVATGDHDMFIFSDAAIAHNESGGIHGLMTGFRTAQSFDDQSNLRFESRIQLANGVVSMPAIHYWNNAAIDNDMILESMKIYSDRGMISPSLNYLMAEDNLTITVDVGFENSDADEKPFPGEYELTLTRNGELLANTTEYDGNEWIVNTRHHSQVET